MQINNVQLIIQQRYLLIITPFFLFHSLSSSIIFLQKAGRSFGLLLVISPLSTTTSSSLQSASAFIRSVLRVLYEVKRFPFNFPVSINIQGAWQIAAIGLPCSKKSVVNFTADSFTLNESEFITPPGNTNIS